MDFDYKNGEITIENSNDNTNKSIGAALVTALVEDSDKTVNISLGKDQYGLSNYVMTPDMLSESKDYPVQVRFDPNSLVPCGVISSNDTISLELEPAFLILAHELIHAYHYLNEEYDGKYYDDKSTKGISVYGEETTYEELNTIGIDYYDIGGNYHSNTNNSAITENNLRTENNMKLRADHKKYNVFDGGEVYVWDGKLYRY